MNTVDTPYEFNKAMLRLNRIHAPPEEKALLLNTVGRSTQSAILYLYLLEHREAVDPRDAGLPEGTTRRLMRLFELRGITVRAGHRRGGNGFMHTTWRLSP